MYCFHLLALPSIVPGSKRQNVHVVYYVHIRELRETMEKMLHTL